MANNDGGVRSSSDADGDGSEEGGGVPEEGEAGSADGRGSDGVQLPPSADSVASRPLAADMAPAPTTDRQRAPCLSDALELFRGLKDDPDATRLVTNYDDAVREAEAYARSARRPGAEAAGSTRRQEVDKTLQLTTAAIYGHFMTDRKRWARAAPQGPAPPTVAGLPLDGDSDSSDSAGSGGGRTSLLEQAIRRYRRVEGNSTVQQMLARYDNALAAVDAERTPAGRRPEVRKMDAEKELQKARQSILERYKRWREARDKWRAGATAGKSGGVRLRLRAGTRPMRVLLRSGKARKAASGGDDSGSDSGHGGAAF